MPVAHIGSLTRRNLACVFWKAFQKTMRYRRGQLLLQLSSLFTQHDANEAQLKLI